MSAASSHCTKSWTRTTGRASEFELIAILAVIPIIAGMKCLAVVALSVVGIVAALGQGRELDGIYKATETPALSPEEAQKRFQAPKGFAMRLFAAEPDIVNPVAMCWDERGRLWVVELYEYPMGAKPGEKPRDRVKILEDMDADGRADKVTIFKDGLDLATGILVGNGGVYVGQAPHLYFFQDTNGDDVADKEEIVLTGFGLEDRHELLNGFCWGPDGYLYFTHGVFTNSKVRRPEQPESEGMKLDAGVARYHPRTRKFEVFADGTSNPWGVDFDRDGNAFVSACVIDHMFHMAAGGLYQRQGGAPEFAYAYELLPSIVDHRHYRAAYAGLQVYQGDQYPPEYQGMVFHGNIHANMIHQDRLTPKGSSFVASHVQDFLVANDGWFRPVSTQTGPDGALWIMDWHDKYPCYQNARANPEGVDRKYGRIWRAVYVGDQPDKPVPSRPSASMDLAKLSSADLVKLLEHPNNWQRRVAQRLLSERKDKETRGALVRLLRLSENATTRQAALLTLHGAELLSEELLDYAAADREATVRIWAARLTGEREPSEAGANRLGSLAEDKSLPVKLAVATALRQSVSATLTANRPKAESPISASLLAIVGRLIHDQEDDQTLAFLVWMALEPSIQTTPSAVLVSLSSASGPVATGLFHKAARRIVDDDPKNAGMILDYAATRFEDKPAHLEATLRGFYEAARNASRKPTFDMAALTRLFAEGATPGVRQAATNLAALWGVPEVLERILAVAKDANARTAERKQALQILSRSPGDSVREVLRNIIATDKDRGLVVDALRALSQAGDDATGGQILELWPKLSPSVRGEAAQTLASRKPWAKALLGAFADGKVARSDVPMAVIRQLNSSRDEELKSLAAKTIGNVRETSRDLAKLIAEKKHAVLQGTPDLAQGKLLAQATCFVCHKFHGEGQDVGPDLTGSGRANLDALLTNIIDPNQIIGNGYENVIVTTKSGQTFAGRVTENNEARVTLLAIGGRQDVISKGDVATLDVTKNSLMPEGLHALPDEQFRDLVWYILNPPEDKRPLTEALRAELIGELPPAAKTKDKDGESVALWNPEWQVDSGEEADAPRRLSEFAGKSHVLQTHPKERHKPAALIRELEAPANAKLSFEVAADDQGDWDLRVMADREEIYKLPIDKQGQRWKSISIDLSRFAGKKITLRLENWANDWNHESGYWREVRIH